MPPFGTAVPSSSFPTLAIGVPGEDDPKEAGEIIATVPLSANPS